MAFGQSVPVSSPVAALAGIVGGELFRFAVKEMGGGEVAQRIANGVGHTLSSAGAGYAINVIGGADVTGAAVTTGQTVVTALLHDSLRRYYVAAAQGENRRKPRLILRYHQLT